MNFYATPGFIQTLVEAAQKRLNVPRDSTNVVIEFDGSDLDNLAYSVIHYFPEPGGIWTSKVYEFDSIEKLIEWTRE